MNRCMRKLPSLPSCAERKLLIDINSVLDPVIEPYCEAGTQDSVSRCVLRYRNFLRVYLKSFVT